MLRTVFVNKLHLFILILLLPISPYAARREECYGFFAAGPDP